MKYDSREVDVSKLGFREVDISTEFSSGKLGVSNIGFREINPFTEFGFREISLFVKRNS